MAKDKLREFTRAMSEDGGAEVIHDLANVESDRGAAMLACSVVEHALRYFLTKHMIPLEPDEDGSLFQNSGPLSDFGGRIKVAFAFGLIDIKMRDDMQLLADIRNAFGHSPRRLSFEADAIKSRCSRFHSLLWTKVMPKTAREQYTGAAKTMFIILKFAGADKRPPATILGMPHMPYCARATPESSPKISRLQPQKDAPPDHPGNKKS